MAKMGHHADMIKALAGPPERMRTNVKALYERFESARDEECIAHETQVVMLFGNAMKRDEQGLPANLFEFVRYLMAKAVEMPETDIDPDQNIMELGADSMTAMSMVKEMETRYSIELPATLLFEYSTLNELVEFLTEEVGEDVANGNAQQA